MNPFFQDEDQRNAVSPMEVDFQDPNFLEAMAQRTAQMNPFTQQQALQAIAPQQFGAPQIPQGGTPPFNPNAPDPRQQPPQGQQGGMGAFLGSPELAMASQAANNIFAARKDQAIKDPVQVYQQAVQNQAIMKLREAQAKRLEAAEARAVGKESRDQEKHDATMNPSWQFDALKEAGQLPAEMSYAEFLQLGKAPLKPSAYAEKAQGLAQSFGYGSVQEGLQSGNKDFLTAFRDLTGSGGITINTGDNPAGTINELTGFDSTKAQENFRANLQGLPDLLNISNQYQDDYLTTVGQTRRRVSGFKDRIGMDLSDEEKADLAAYTQFTNNVEQQFNTYRKLITGAAGSEQELEGLRKSIENLDQGPTAFKASLDNRMENQARQLRGAIYLQALGEAEMGTPAMGDLLAKRSQDSFNSTKVTDTVGDYIAVSLGFDPDNLTNEQGSAVKQKLIGLGFFSENK